jgi:hypothetical protein
VVLFSWRNALLHYDLCTLSCFQSCWLLGAFQIRDSVAVCAVPKLPIGTYGDRFGQLKEAVFSKYLGAFGIEKSLRCVISQLCAVRVAALVRMSRVSAS